MPASNRRDLFISVNGSIDGLSNALKAGRTTLLDFDQAAGSIVDQISNNLKNMGAGSAAGANEAVKNYQRAFDQIKASAAAAANDPGASLKIFDTNALNAQIVKAEQAAATNRLVAETAQKVAAAGGESAAIQLQLAAAYGAAAVKGEQEVIALRQQAIALGEVRGALGADIIQSDNVTHASGRMSIAKMELMHVVRASSDAFAAGAPITQIFSMELGRMAEAAALSGGSMGKLGALLGGPFGLALTAGIAVLAPFIAKLFEAGDAADAAADKLKKEALQTEITAKAHDAFRLSIEGVTAATNEAKRANDKWLDGEGSAARAAAISAQARLLEAEAVRKSTVAKLENAKADLVILMNAQGRGGQMGDLQGQVSIDAGNKISALDAEIAKIDSGMTDLRARVSQTLADVADEEAKKAADPIERIKRLYEAPDGLIAQKRKELAAAQATTAEMGRQLGILHEQERAAIKAEQKRESDAKKTQPTGSPSSALLSTAESFRGAREGSATLTELFSKAGINIDPKITAWCAAFVNAVLATDGLKGTGSLSAKSFLTYGAATNAPQKGDIVVASRQGGGHVGFFEGFDKDGNVKVLGGNTGNKVGVETIARANVLGYRRAPASAQAEEKTAETAADKEAARQKAFDDQLAKAQGDQITSQLALTSETEEQAKVKIARIESERKALVADVAAALAADKIPGATEKERKANADKLVATYNATAAIKKEGVTRDEMSKILRQQLDAARADADRGIRLLDLQGALARTTKERLALALQILDIEYRLKKKLLDATIADPKSTDEQRKQAGLDRAQLDKEYGLQKTRAHRENAGPLDQYRDQLHAATDDMNEALQGVAVHGLQSLEDGLLGVINGTESVGSAFKKMAASIIADLARIAIEKAIVGAIGKSFFGFSEGVVPGHARGVIPGFADGIISGPGTGTSDSIPGWMAGVGPIMVSNGEGIMNARAVRNFGPILKAMNDNSLRGFAAGNVPSFPSLPNARSLSRANDNGGAIDVRVTLSDDLHATIDNRAANVSVEVFKAGAPTMIQAATRNTINTLGRPGL